MNFIQRLTGVLGVALLSPTLAVAAGVTVEAGSELSAYDFTDLGVDTLVLIPRHDFMGVGNMPLPLNRAKCVLAETGVRNFRQNVPVKVNMGGYWWSSANKQKTFTLALTVTTPNPNNREKTLELPFMDCELPKAYGGPNEDKLTVNEIQGYLNELFAVQAIAKVNR
jgi:hypothetical protein